MEKMTSCIYKRDKKLIENFFERILEKINNYPDSEISIRFEVIDIREKKENNPVYAEFLRIN